MSKSVPFDVILVGSEEQICMTEIFTTDALRRIAREKMIMRLNWLLIILCIFLFEEGICLPFHRCQALRFKLFTSPFDFPVDEAPAPLQMKLMEL